MSLLDRGREVYKDYSREIQYKVDSLFILHFSLMLLLLIMPVIYGISGHFEKIPFSLLSSVVILISLKLAYNGKYELSASILSGTIFLFLTMMLMQSDEVHPFTLYRTALYLVAPTMLSSLLLNKIRMVYFFTLMTLIILTITFTTKVIPGNPDLEFGELFSEYFVFILILLTFIAHFVFKKHRITIRLIKESEELMVESNSKAKHISVLLEEVQKSIGITTGLLDEVNAIEEKIKVTNEKLNVFKHDMDQFENSFSESSVQLSEIGTQISGLNSIVLTQASAQEESAAATNQMVSSINNVSIIVNKKVESASVLMNTTEKGGQKLNDTVTIIQAISSRVDSILEMVNLINDIASKTNLLSMNAAIEAAHAGDSGRGFAVVADEIRKLAEDSSKNALSITSILKEVVQNINDSFESGTSTKEAYQLISSEVKGAGNAFYEISTTTSELNEGSKEILTSLTELTDLTKDVRGGTGLITKSQEVIQNQLDLTGSRITAIINDIDFIIQGNSDIELSIKKINEIAATLKKLNEELHIKKV